MNNSSNIYEAKITSVEQGHRIVKGTTKAPDGSKVLISNYDEKSIQYRENGSQSISGKSLPKVNNKKFKCSVDSVVICDADQEKKGTKIKVLSFAITNYHQKWDVSEISNKNINKAKKRIKPQYLTVSESQEEYYNSLGPRTPRR
ncbi:hypothetical protein DS832_07940 [Bombilactobacillus bombi]|uniref:Uncharacterized protein n=1 Tax=Bombilactobacillus bombi TaxID=1303590 RepID=A0A417Z4R2_9LACO|nr:hypothetical protein DS832_07940 [Bombilactobacillus bombi]